MGGDAAGVFKHLLMMPATMIEEKLASVLETLWSTRDTGLSTLQKRDIQSLLALDSIRELDLVLVSLRSIIRKFRRHSLSRDEIQKLLPLELPAELQGALLALLEKHRSDAEGQASRQEETRVSHEGKVNAPNLWPRKDQVSIDAGNGAGYPAPAKDPQSPHMKENFTDLQSMTWTIENPNSRPSQRMAVICLKLQDYTKSTAGEVEVKIQLSRDTLDAMLRSITYINDQLSN